MIFRLYHETLGGHVHCRLFAGKHDGALGKCGDLTMRVEEFEVFKAAASFMQFRPEDRNATNTSTTTQDLRERGGRS